MSTENGESSDENIKAHIEKQVATRVLASPIYAFLFKDCLRITECAKGLVRARISLEHRHVGDVQLFNPAVESGGADAR